MGKKALFFDIDGTIWDFHNRICESTVEAMKKLHDNGHLTFICSGRSPIDCISEFFTIVI